MGADAGVKAPGKVSCRAFRSHSAAVQAVATVMAASPARIYHQIVLRAPSHVMYTDFGVLHTSEGWNADSLALAAATLLVYTCMVYTNNMILNSI